MLNKVGMVLMLLGILVSTGGASLGSAFGFPAAIFLFVVGLIMYLHPFT